MLKQLLLRGRGKLVNQTIEKFGYPDSLIKEYGHWVVLLRPQQATLGALILACKEPVLSFGELSAEAFAEMRVATAELEACLKKCFSYQKINYLMLMMVDPDVHFHVLPRYDLTREFASVSFADPGWPALPKLDHAASLNEDCRSALTRKLKDNW
jgi:diadenosine tetraphosphate (Ap4A) HIT family hydrolase